MPVDQHSYGFDGTISRPVLERYLSRSVSMAGLCQSPQRDEDLRMLHHIGAKYVGRVAYIWAQHEAEDDEAHFDAAAQTVADYQRFDGDAIFQAAIFEAVHERFVSNITVPAWVFEEFDQPAQQRCFDYDAMLYDRGRDYGEPAAWRPHGGNDWFHGRWRPPAAYHWMRGRPADAGSVPDMSKLETRMWFFYRARRYIDAGYQALHLGQVHLMDHGDPGWRHWWELLTRIRRYGREHARRHMVLLDAHTHGAAMDDGRLLFDLHSFPLYIKDVGDHPERTELAIGFKDAIFGKSLGGITPSGWSCDALPYIVEFDNYGSSGRPGQHFDEGNWVWGCDEITWFARQPEDYRNDYLRYAHHRVRQLDPHGHLQMPGQRGLYEPAEGVKHYFANTRSPASPTGFNQEETIRRVWAEH
ncbi:MAG: hypothetical protein WD042_01840 [Phycisphaeraceae bacterium]